MGILLCFIIIPVVLIMGAIGIIKTISYDCNLRRLEKEENERKLAEEETKQFMLDQQKELVEQYKRVLAKEIQREFGEELGLPERILIYDRYVQGERNGKVWTYDFVYHDVKTFEMIGGAFDSEEDLKYVIHPQLALATAINEHFGNRYRIYDKARRETRSSIDCDGDLHTCIFYTSDHVLMDLNSVLIK